jgi:hypothetical protein
MHAKGFIMKKIFAAIFAMSCLVSQASHSAEFDTEDPLYFEKANDLAVRGGAAFGDSILDIELQTAYGVNDLFVISADIRYQQDFNDRRNNDGFSHAGFGITYRMSADTVISDVFAGVNFAGGAVPGLDHVSYSGGLRIGRQWDTVTLSGMLKTSWIFDETDGMAWINLAPDAYFRITEDWRIGLGFDFRKATNPDFDATTAGLRVVRQYGRTQYVGFGEYEFEHSDLRFGGRINVVF